MGWARGPEVGHQRRSRRGFWANHDSTSVAWCLFACSTTPAIRLSGGAGRPRRMRGPGCPLGRRAPCGSPARASRPGPRRCPLGGGPQPPTPPGGGPAQSRPARVAARPASGLAPLRECRRRCAWAWRGLRETRMGGHVRCLIEEPRCANLMWTDLVVPYN
jgi:hypothetical protein